MDLASVSNQTAQERTKRCWHKTLSRPPNSKNRVHVHMYMYVLRGFELKQLQPSIVVCALERNSLLPSAAVRDMALSQK